MAVSLLIAASNFVLGLGFLLWLAALGRGRAKVVWHPIFIPIMGWVLWSFVSAAFSDNLSLSWLALDNLLTLIMVPMVVSILNPGRWGRFLGLIAVSSALSSVVALGQIVVFGVDLEHRVPGVFSHYMTFAGWTMAVVLILVGEVLKGKEPRRLRWILPILGLHAVVLSLSLTRNAWVGIAVALGLAAMVWRSRTMLAIPLVVVVAVAVLPSAVRDRVISITDLEQPANRDRIAMIEAGAAMVTDHPWVGVGPDMVKELYPGYRRPGAVRDAVSHLHCNPVHIAAERGLPALAMYGLLLIIFGVSVVRGLKDPEHPAESALASCLLAVVGLTVAGLFEYNWGDSEIWIVTLFVLAVPAALEKR
ncbi:MAG: O-antigen ligase family protein [Acidobacteriota bacterium]